MDHSLGWRVDSAEWVGVRRLREVQLDVGDGAGHAHVALDLVEHLLGALEDLQQQWVVGERREVHLAAHVLGARVVASHLVVLLENLPNNNRKQDRDNNVRSQCCKISEELVTIIKYLGEALVVHDSKVLEADALAVEVHEREHQPLGLKGVDALLSL